MTNQPEQWTRRQFSQALAATAVSATLVRKATALPVANHEGFAFVGSSTADPMDGTVRVYRASGAAWREVHAIDAAAPVHLTMHPAVPVLYVLHGVAEWDHRPRGAVSAYRFEAATGHLSHLGTQPLSLSATHPRHAVVTADGQALFVAAESGGIYNVLPIVADGSLHRVTAIRKELGMQHGSSGKTAAPGHMVLQADGSVYATDPGQGTVTRFSVSRNAITLRHRSHVCAATGASQLREADAGSGETVMHTFDRATFPLVSPCLVAGGGSVSSLLLHRA